MLKQCKKCGETKAIKLFYREKRNKDGFKSYCKLCVVNYATKWNKVNLQAYKLTHKKWRTKNFEYMTNNVYRWIDRCTKGVYFIQASNGTYVGQSKAIERRVTEHNRSANKNTNIEKVISYKVIEVIEDPIVRFEREAYWIKKLNPSLNTRLSS
tara:strand:- start:143 stop:604 length:462 start_codon:yes stop_codon:yes gene_type:complete